VTTTLVLNSVSLVLHSTAGTVRREAGGDGRVRSAAAGGRRTAAQRGGAGSLVRTRVRMTPAAPGAGS